MQRDTILIVTQVGDVHTDAVIDELNRYGARVVVWHTDNYSETSIIKMGVNDGHIVYSVSNREFSLSSLLSCWFRRALPVTVNDPSVSEVEKSIILQESEALLTGIYGCSDTVWYSHPYFYYFARSKVYQLAVAEKVGLAVPSTLISNDVQELCTFAEELREVVVKPISEGTTHLLAQLAGIGAWVRKVTPQKLRESLADGAPSPMCLQQYVKKQFDVRLTVVGRDLFPVAIKITNYPDEADWRFRAREHEHVVISCPPSVEEAVLRYMCHMGLNFGAFDFSVDEDGNWWFLECNANGQWLWIQQRTGLEIARSIARHLLLHEEPLVRRTPMSPIL